MSLKKFNNVNFMNNTLVTIINNKKNLTVKT